MIDLVALASIIGVFLLACCSPGAVFLLITSTAMTTSRRQGMMIGLGVASATLTWAAVTSLGLGVLLSQVVWLSVVIKVIGGAYLIWLGIKSLTSPWRPIARQELVIAGDQDLLSFFRAGYLVSITNSKALAFFSSIFAVMLPASTTSAIFFIVTIGLFAVSAAWHCGLALIFSTRPLQRLYMAGRKTIDVAVGLVLILLGARLISSSR